MPVDAVRPPPIAERPRGWMPPLAFALGFGLCALWHARDRLPTTDASAIYTLYMGRSDGHGGHDDVRTHVATFDLDERERDANLNKCTHVQAILQHRSTESLVFWCERGRYHG
jgi:hypothetical protein